LRLGVAEGDWEDGVFALRDLAPPVCALEIERSPINAVSVIRS
jgi:hypothetical protein